MPIWNIFLKYRWKIFLKYRWNMFLKYRWNIFGFVPREICMNYEIYVKSIWFQLHEILSWLGRVCSRRNEWQSWCWPSSSSSQVFFVIFLEGILGNFEHFFQRVPRFFAQIFCWESNFCFDWIFKKFTNYSKEELICFLKIIKCLDETNGLKNWSKLIRNYQTQPPNIQ